jgi:hypothetical protein
MDGFPEDLIEDPERAFGGADAVEKTTYVVGKGTDPEARPDGGPIARVPPSPGLGVTWTVIIFLVVLAVLVYLLGFGS